MLFDNLDGNISKIIEKGDIAKKKSNTNHKFSVLWRNEFAPPCHIGHTNKLLHKYGILRTYGNYEQKLIRYIKEYLEDADTSFNSKTTIGSYGNGRSVEQIRSIAQRISTRCCEENIRLTDGMENNIEELMCLIINHACTETLSGKYSELVVEEYFNSFGYVRNNLTDISDSEWDTNGVDILLYNEELIFRFVQVKPKSFLLGNKPDLCIDREKCKSINQVFIDNYIQTHFTEIHKDARSEIIYCFYDKDHSFINFDGNKNDYGVFIIYEDFANDDGTAKYTANALTKLPTVSLTNFKKKVCVE